MRWRKLARSQTAVNQNGFAFAACPYGALHGKKNKVFPHPPGAQQKRAREKQFPIGSPRRSTASRRRAWHLTLSDPGFVEVGVLDRFGGRVAVHIFGKVPPGEVIAVAGVERPVFCLEDLAAGAGGAIALLSAREGGMISIAQICGFSTLGVKVTLIVPSLTSTGTDSTYLWNQ